MKLEIDLKIDRIDQDNIKVGMAIIDGEDEVRCKIKPADSIYLSVGDSVSINLPLDFSIIAN